MNNETLNAENVEIDLETLDNAMGQGFGAALARWKIVEAVIDALDPADRKKLEEYRNQ